MRNPFENFDSRFEHEGRQHELACLGKMNINDSEYKKRLAELQREDGFITKKDAFRIVEEFPAYDPANPAVHIANDIKIEVEDLLSELTGKDMAGKVEIYTAIDSPLDRKGIDGFIKYKDKGGNVYRVTLDPSLNPKKLRENYKGAADIIIGDIPAPEIEEKKYLATIEKIGKQIFAILKEKIGEKNMDN